MEMVVMIGVVVNLVFCVALSWLWLRLRARYKSLAEESEELAKAARAVPPELAKLLSSKKQRVMTVEILNPMELAAKQSWFAGQFGSLSPDLINKIVYDRAAKMIGNQLPEFGVVADVRVHRGRGKPERKRDDA